MNKINSNVIGGICCAACCIVLLLSAAIDGDRAVIDNAMFLFFVPFIAMCIFFAKAKKENKEEDKDQ